MKFMRNTDVSTFLENSVCGLNDDGKWSEIFDDMMHNGRAIEV